MAPSADFEQAEAWRQAREELARTRDRLAARSRELDTLQALGRRAAEAGSPDELFAALVSVLARGRDLDLAVVGHELDAAPRITLFLARPFDDPLLDEMVARAGRFLGRHDGVRDERRHLEGYDGARGPRAEIREEELVFLPVLRRGRPAACLLLLPARPPDEGDLRLFYGATNQLSLHLDRILTVREAEADRFRAIVDAMPQGVLLADERLRVVQRNHSARRMTETLGLDDDANLGALLERLDLVRLVDEVRRGAATAEGESRLPDDAVWSATVSPLGAEGGAISGFVLVLADVSESRRMQRRLAQSEKISSLGLMISGVAHELNNPLATMVGYAQLLGRESDERQAERLRILRREADRCRRIVENLLAFVRQRKPEVRPLSLNQVVRDTLPLLAYQLRVDGIRVEVEEGAELPAIEGDAHQLGQVLVNLLTNARQAIRQAAATGTVRLVTRRDGRGRAVLEVHDDGPGIPAELRSRIFDPFFTTKEPGQGTGLGLSLVYGIVTAHGGVIDVDPAPAGGTVFRIGFPPGRSRRPEPAAARPAPSRGATCRGRILVVEDEEPVARLICEALADDGHETRHARDGDEALARLAAGEFDLVISDVRMPGIGGELLAEMVRDRNPELAARLLLTTGDTLGCDVEALRERTGIEVLRKPFDLEELRRAVSLRLTEP